MNQITIQSRRIVLLLAAAATLGTASIGGGGGLVPMTNGPHPHALTSAFVAGLRSAVPAITALHAVTSPNLGAAHAGGDKK